MKTLPFRLERTVHIRAEPGIVFRYFTESARFAAWWGAGSTIDPRPGGAVVIRYPNAIVASGTVESVVPGKRIVFTYGYEDPSRGLPPGTSRVTLTVQATADGTRLDLVHELPTEALRDMHDAGWRYQLSVFANVATREQQPAEITVLDRYFAAWNEPEAAARRAILEEIAEADIEFRDGFAAIAGRPDVDGHIAALHVHLAGTRIERSGEPRLCQGFALVDWVVRRGDGQAAGQGTNSFEFSAQGRLRRVIGFWRA